MPTWNGRMAASMDLRMARERMVIMRRVLAVAARTRVPRCIGRQPLMWRQSQRAFEDGRSLILRGSDGGGAVLMESGVGTRTRRDDRRGFRFGNERNWRGAN
jgi:hypothetical protein